MRRSNVTTASLATLSVIVLASATTLAAEQVKIEGLIVGRSGDEIVVQFGSGAELAFQLTDTTKVSLTLSVVEGPVNERSREPGLQP